MRHVIVLLAALCAPLGSASAQQAQPQPQPQGEQRAAIAMGFEEETRLLRVRIDGRPVQLETFTVKRKGVAGRLPVALITHGKPPDRVSMGDMRGERMRQQARDMARRGWLAVVVIRRGFGQSDGPPAPDMTCADVRMQQRFERDAQDLAAALGEVQKRPDAEPDGAIAMGVSAGGAAALALGAMQPQGLRAVINISGGLKVAECIERSETALVETVRALAPRIKVPNLWVYADNDSFFGPKVVDRMYEAALDKGMQVRRVALPATGQDGHDIFGTSQGRRAWLLELDQSLRGWSLPTWPRNLINDLAREMRIAPDRNRTVLERYIAAPGEKAMVFSPSTGRMFFRFGGGSSKAVEDGAMKDCADAGLKDCRLALRDNAPAGT